MAEANTLKRDIFLVVNTNVLFSFFGKSTKTRELIFLLSGMLVSPEFAIEELVKHKDAVIRKAKIRDEDFEKLISVLRRHIVFVEESFYSEYIPLALEISPDSNDADFVALSLKTGDPLWSNDTKLKSIKEITVLNTGELIKILQMKD